MIYLICKRKALILIDFFPQTFILHKRDPTNYLLKYQQINIDCPAIFILLYFCFSEIASVKQSLYVANKNELSSVLYTLKNHKSKHYCNEQMHNFQ